LTVGRRVDPVAIAAGRQLGPLTDVGGISAGLQLWSLYLRFSPKKTRTGNPPLSLQICPVSLRKTVLSVRAIRYNEVSRSADNGGRPHLEVPSHMIKDIALIVLGVWAFFYMSDRMEPNTLRYATVFSVIAVVLRLAWAILVRMWEAAPPL